MHTTRYHVNSFIKANCRVTSKYMLHMIPLSSYKRFDNIKIALPMFYNDDEIE